MLRTFIGIVFLILPYASHAQSKSGALRLIHAGEFERNMVAGKVKQSLTGGVEFRKAETIITCQRAEQTIGVDPVALIGSVRIVDESGVLDADTVLIYQETNIQVAKGRVKSITERDTTTADKITYFTDEQKVESVGRVRIANREDRSVVVGGKALYFRESEFGKVTDDPEFFQLDSLGLEVMHVGGDTMALLSGGDTTVVTGRVNIDHGETQATCGRANYFRLEKRTRLTQSPRVKLPNREITGDTLELLLDGGKLTQATVIGDAMAVSDADTLSPGRWENKLTGQRMVFAFTNGVLESVVIENQATSLFHVVEDRKYRGANEVSGDRILVQMQDGTVRKITVVSDPEFSAGKYIPPKSD